MSTETSETKSACTSQRYTAAKPRVAVARVESAVYPTVAPYHPSRRYPEYPFGGAVAGEQNLVYDGVRDLLLELGLDREASGTAAWSPFRTLMRPGMCVVLKPNFVLSRHAGGKDLFAIITHPSVLRAVADYCWIALKGQGQIIIADAPQYNCNFSQLLQQTHLEKICDFYGSFAGPVVSFRDLRKYWSPGRHFASMRQPLAGDPAGSVRVDLGSRSALADKPHSERLYGAVYHRDETVTHHSGERQIYEISGTILGADVVISVPKLKVHKKVGVTLNAKGLVGIATNKNLIVHYTLGSPAQGGDQYPEGLFTPIEEKLIKTERWMYDHLLAPRSRPLEFLHRSVYWLHNNTTRRLGLKVSEEKRQLDAGNWYGNDSAWRMVVDLLRIFYFADREGKMQDKVQRRMFSVIDGVIGGEGCGPLTPDPKPSRMLIGGENPLAVDLVATRLMGFDPLSLKMYKQALADLQYDFGLHRLEDIQVCSREDEWKGCVSDQSSRYLDFKPHPGWVGRI